jgi:hypothetical protein
MKIDYKRTTFILAIVLAISLLVNVRVLAGNIDSSAGPGATSSYSLEDIYNRLTTGADGSQHTFTEPGSGPGATMHTLNDIMTKSPAMVDALTAATPADVVSGKEFWGLGPGGTWGKQTGAMMGQRALPSINPVYSKVLDAMNSDGTPNDPDTEPVDVRLLLNPDGSGTLSDIIGVPSGYYYQVSGTLYSGQVKYPVSLSSLVGTPTYDPYTGVRLTMPNSYNPLWIDNELGVYHFNTHAPLALRLRSVLSELAATAAALR